MLGVVVGWLTNALGMWLIFEPPEPRRILGIRVHGLFPRRQDEAAEVYARIIADDVITLERIGNICSTDLAATAPGRCWPRHCGPRSTALPGRPAPPSGWRSGPARFDTIRESVAREAVGRTLTRSGTRVQPTPGREVRALFATRTKELPPRDFVEMMRAAIKEDEWMLYAHGAIMGLGGASCTCGCSGSAG